MDNIFRVLSVDFDFFQNTNKDLLFYYPDGVDNNTHIAEFIWNSHYFAYGDKLRNIDIDKKLFKELLYIIDSQSISIPVMAVNSHKHIVKFIEDNYNSKSIAITHIDYHHDMMNNNSSEIPDCGNWLGYMFKKHKGLASQWITRESSIDMYGLTPAEVSEAHILYDFSSIENAKFDAMFFCRSDTWTPPHLDKYFTEIVEHLSGFYSRLIEPCVTKERTIDTKIFEKLRNR